MVFKPGQHRKAGLDTPSTVLAGRYAIRRRLGSGGMGVVYEAHDRTRNTIVAIKVPHRSTAGSLYRFKREFRSLDQVAHRNLVTLYELVNTDDQWFLTMELVDGVDFLQYVRGDGDATGMTRRHGGETRTAPQYTTTLGDREVPAALLSAHSQPQQCAPGRPLRLDRDRFRDALGQLVDGLHALHASGQLHRDIKPSNVLVNSGGRVVILDFGGVIERSESEGEVERGQVYGTPHYMAPETRLHGQVSEASDWFAVGVLMYQAMTGHPPPVLEALMDEHTVISPRRRHPELPRDLDRLCTELLAWRPGDRPDGAEIAARLGRSGVPCNRPSTDQHTPRPELELIGRRRHLELLHHAWGEVKSGRPAAVLVHGEPGAGKTALVSRFLDSARLQPDAVVLTGRCYVRESVPYQAIDSLVDALARFGENLPDDELVAVLPRGIHWLTQAFPVLTGIAARAGLRRRAVDAPEPRELKRRVCDAFVDFLAAIAERWPLVLFIDDLQWGDVDSAPFINRLLGATGAPRLLFLASYRSENRRSSRLLRALLEGDGLSHDRLRHIEVEPLGEALSRSLAGSLLRSHGFDTARAAEIARESGGNPYFITEIVRSMHQAGPHRAADALTLERVILERFAQLPGHARRLLEVTALAGKPVDQHIAQRAADIRAGSWPELIHALRVLHLVRFDADGTGIELYHDRIREAITHQVPGERGRQHHRDLARCLDAAGAVEPEELMHHLAAAGDREAAAECAIHAADHAAKLLAHDRAAQYYRRALSLGSWSAKQSIRVRRKLGDALAYSGAGVDAAEVFLDVAETSTDLQALDLRRRAAEYLLRSGHVERGRRVLEWVLRDTGLPMPRSKARVLAATARHQLRLRYGKLTVNERPAGDIPAETLERVDASFTAGLGLAGLDPLLSRYFHTLNFKLALAVGEPGRIAIACFLQSYQLAMAGGPRTLDRAVEILDIGCAAGDRVDPERSQAASCVLRGIIQFRKGHLASARALLGQANTIFRERRGGEPWELFTTRLIALLSMTLQGDLSELVRRADDTINEAKRTGDIFGHRMSSWLAGCRAWLATGDVDRVVAELGEEPPVARGNLMTAPAVAWALARAELDLYTGDPAAAYDHVDDLERRAKWLIDSFSYLRVCTRRIRACAAIAAAVDHPEQHRRWLRSAKRDIKFLSRRCFPPARPWGAILHAAWSYAKGMRQSDVVDHLKRAIKEFSALGMTLDRVMAQRRLGQILASSEDTVARGRAMLAAADDALARQAIAAPDRLATLYAPGFVGAEAGAKKR
ncbi:MAG: protein kinase [Proteobacteria bacterium]|nr:protein kinase [Pseudomonadota bacterium]